MIRRKLRLLRSVASVLTLVALGLFAGAGSASADPSSPNPLPSIPTVGSNGEVNFNRIAAVGVAVFALITIFGAIVMAWKARHGGKMTEAAHQLGVFLMASVVLVFGLSAALIVYFGKSILGMFGLG